jgi:ribosome-associated heat shock protein Hsp15
MTLVSQTVRLDVWLDVACLFKTRSEAQRACKGGKVEVNGVSAKPHRDVRIGDELVITRPLGRRQTIVVAALSDTHVPRAEARQLYEDRTPAPTPEELETRRLERLFRATAFPSRKPDRRQRRELVRRKRET